MLKCCLENFPSLKSSKTRVIILNICFKIQLYRPNKHSYDTPATTSSLKCKNILKNFVVNEKQRKYTLLVNFCQKACSCQSTSASHIDQRDIRAFQRPLYKGYGGEGILLWFRTAMYHRYMRTKCCWPKSNSNESFSKRKNILN
jgi:hypothetical protein